MKCEWKEIPFGELLEIPLRNGVSKPKSVRGNGYKMVNMGELFSNSRIYDIEMDRAPLTEKEKETSLVEVGDLLFARQSLVFSGAGKCSIIKEVCESTTYESHLIRARINRDLASPDYMYYYFSSPQGRGRIQSIVEQVSAAGIRGSDLSKLDVSVPSLEIQEKIADILCCFDDKIELNNKINANLQQQAQAIFKSWFVDFEPFQDGEFVESELGTIPVEFTITRTGGLPLIVTDYVANGSFASLKANVHLYQERNYAYFIRNTDLKSGEFKVFVDEHSYNFLSKSRLQGGEIIISNVGDVGSVFLCPVLGGPMTLGNNIIMLKPERQELQYYLYIWFKWSLGQSLMQGIKSGSAQPKFNKTDFKSLPIVLPPEKILQEFHELVSPIFKLVEKNQVENRKIAMLRDVLLPKLMNGAIDIRKD